MNRSPCTFRFAIIGVGLVVALQWASAARAQPAAEPVGLQQAWQAYRTDRVAEASRLLQGLPAEVRALPDAALLLGLVRYRQKQYLLAEGAFARVSLSHPAGIAARFNRALCLLALGRKVEARRAYRELYRARTRVKATQRPVLAAALYNVSVAAAARGDRQTARETARLVIQGFSKDTAARHAQELLRLLAGPPLRVRATACVTHYRARRYLPARRCFQRLLLLVGPNAQVQYAIGYASYQLKQYRAAVGSFRRVLLLQPRDGDALFMLALARAHQTRYPAALKLFQRALQAGLRSEDPKEARRYIRKIKKILQQRLRSGWIVVLTVGGGFDSHPRLEGSAASASTSEGAAGEASGVADLRLALGYRWLHTRRALTTLGYRFHQMLVFSDLQQTSTGGPGRNSSEVSGMSLQTHQARVASRYVGRRISAGGAVAGGVELSGLRDFGALAANTSLSAELQAHWHRVTDSRLGAGYLPQWALSPELAYLTGHGLWAEVSQSARFKRYLKAELSYRFEAWWLGTFDQELGDCVAGETCALRVPYSNVLHLGRLELTSRPTTWLRLGLDFGLGYRVYLEEGVYRPTSGGQIALQRRDRVLQVFALASFRIWRRVFLEAFYRFTDNDSTVDLETTGIEEGYQRHEVGLRVAYRRR